MSMSTAALSPIGLGLSSNVIGKKRYQYTDTNYLGSFRPVAPSVRLQPLKCGKLVPLASRVLSIDPALIGRKLGLEPLQSRRTARSQSAITICAAVFTAMAETQTLPRRSPSSVVSVPEKETMPMLDDGGSGSGFGDQFGNKPYYRGDDSGAGGGGGSGGSLGGSFPWGDFWFLIFCFFLYFLFKQIIDEGAYKKKDGTYKSIRRFL